MNIKVMYHSKTGNTKKIAEAIAGAADVSAELITENTALSESIDLLFIGDGIYMGKIDQITKDFIETLTSSTVKNAAVFGTFGGQNKAIDEMNSLLKARGIHTNDESFGCKGRAWLVLNRNRPDKADIDKAQSFCRDVIASASK